jgi:hypothetical protein
VNGIWPEVTSSPGADDAHDLRAHALDGDVERLEDARGEALLLAEQAEQDVLGADVVVLERPRLLLGEDDHLAGSFCESLEHWEHRPAEQRAEQQRQLHVAHTEVAGAQRGGEKEKRRRRERRQRVLGEAARAEHGARREGERTCGKNDPVGKQSRLEVDCRHPYEDRCSRGRNDAPGRGAGACHHRRRRRHGDDGGNGGARRPERRTFLQYRSAAHLTPSAVPMHPGLSPLWTHRGRSDRLGRTGLFGRKSASAVGRAP